MRLDFPQGAEIWKVCGDVTVFMMCDLRITELTNCRADERGLLEFIRDDANRAMDFHDASNGAKEGDAILARAVERCADAVGLVDDELSV